MSGSLGLGLMGIGTVLGGAGRIATGSAAYAAAQGRAQALDYQSAEMNQRATQAMAAGASRAQIASLNTAYMLSRARANAAASGGTATSPTAIGVMGQIGARGEYDALNAIFSGKSEMQGYQNQATLDQYMAGEERKAGSYARTAGMIGGVTSVLSGFGNIAAKYGSAGGMPGGYSTLSPSQNPEYGGAYPAGGLT